ncbi:MAG: GIY-YIG nuclease family protein, partial [Methanogenium sp.]|nr:GIY-YIG nuclease family protein [Methanogenium sp.]
MIDLSVLPEEPGCYLFHDVNGTIIYIGKAKNLKVRISGYFSRQERDPKTEALVRSIESLDFIVTDNEVESLILENTLIKKHQPHYNIDLKDSKNYAYISISDEKFPGIWIARKNTGPGLYYGPFVSARERDYILSVVKKTFKLRSCRQLPKRPCLRYHMGSCISPCTGNVSTDEYHALVAKADSVLRGNTGELITTLNAEMAQKSSEHKYEEAIVLRDQITAIKHLDERQHVDRQKSYDEDI